MTRPARIALAVVLIAFASAQAQEREDNPRPLVLFIKGETPFTVHSTSLIRRALGWGDFNNPLNLSLKPMSYFIENWRELAGRELPELLEHERNVTTCEPPLAELSLFMEQKSNELPEPPAQPLSPLYRWPHIRGSTANPFCPSPK